MIKINISTDYTMAPGPRYKKQGEFSGEDFRTSILKPKFEEARKNNDKITIILDGTYGYFDSFLEESFGGLAREFNDNTIGKYFNFISLENPSLEEKIQNYIAKSILEK